MGTTRDDGSQQAMWVATADLPQGGGHPFYERLNEILGAAGFDAFVEEAVRAVLCADGAAESGAGPVFPAAAGRVFRRPRLGAGDCVACGRFVESAVVPASGASVGAARPLDDLADAAAAERRDPCGGVHLGAAAACRRGLGAGQDGGYRRDRRWRRMRRCGASSAARRARTTRRS